MVLVIFVIVVLFLLVVTVLWLTRSTLFAPDKNMVWEPEEDYRNVFIPDLGGHKSINGWYFERDLKAPCILFFHGNNGNISWREYMVKATMNLGVNMFMIDYRGFGMSPGKPTQKGVCQDGISAFDYISNVYKPDDIIIWGESLGGSIATYVASERECRCLVLFSTFSSLDDIILASDKNPWVMKAMAFLVKYLTDEMPTKTWIEDVSSPVVVIHSQEDTLIPYSVSQKLYNHIKHDQKHHITIKGDHTNPDLDEDTLCSILDVCKLPHGDEKAISKIVSAIESVKFPTS